MDRASEQVTDAATERLALEVPQGDVDRGDGVGGDPAAVAVPPRPILESPPDCVGVYRVGADDELVEAVDERGDRGIGLGELGDRLAPADLAVVGGQLDQAQVPGGVEVVGLGIGDRDRFHLDDTHLVVTSARSEPCRKRFQYCSRFRMRQSSYAASDRGTGWIGA